MDFIERLSNNVNMIVGLPIRCKMGYLETGESFCVYPLPGSKVIREYFDGMKDQQLNFEFAMKSNDQQKITNTLWLVQNHLEELSELTSSDGSFDFEQVIVTNKPFINQLDEKGEYIFILDVQAQITTYPRGEK